MTDPSRGHLRDLSAPRRRVLFVCTHNAARSQIAEAILARKGRDHFDVASAGSDPAQHLHPLAVEVLREHGIDWSGHRPKGFDAVAEQRWDFVITVCDRARESCPTFPGQPVFAHWGVEDPSECQGDNNRRRLAFREAVTYLSRRIDLLLALPIERLDKAALEARLRASDDVLAH